MSCISRFLCFAQLAKSRHVLANLDGLPLGLGNRLRSFFGSQTPTIGPLDSLG